MSLTLTYDNVLSRVQIDVTDLTDAVIVDIERSANQITWTTVRGGAGLTPVGGVVSLNDYEFVADAINYYRVRGATIFDDFNRTVAAGSWGSSTSGHAYTVEGTAAQYSVGSGTGKQSINALSTYFRSRLSPSLTDVDVLAAVTVPVTPTGDYIRVELGCRRVDGNNYYSIRAHILTNNTIDLLLKRVLASVESNLAVAGSGVTRVPGTKIWMRLQNIGTTVRARVWNDGTTEPSTWPVSAVDASFTTGTINMASLLPPANSNTQPVVIEWDDLLVATPVGTIFSGSITPTLDSVWLKNIGKPFLNKAVDVIMGPDQSITRQPRDGLFQIVGRSYPVAVTDLRTSRSWTMQVRTGSRVDADELDLILAAGDVMYVQPPADCQVRGGHVRIGPITQQWHPLRPEECLFTLPLTEVAAPADTVIPAIGTWQTVVSTYTDWSDVVASHPTWGDLLTLVGSPADTVVP